MHSQGADGAQLLAAAARIGAAIAGPPLERRRHACRPTPRPLLLLLQLQLGGRQLVPQVLQLLLQVENDLGVPLQLPLQLGGGGVHAPRAVVGCVNPVWAAPPCCCMKAVSGVTCQGC